MIHVAAPVVADHRSDVLRHVVQVAEQVLDAAILQLWVLLQRRVQIVDVRPVVAIVVDLHGLRVDVRLEGVEAIRKRRQLVRHQLIPPSNPRGLRLRRTPITSGRTKPV